MRDRHKRGNSEIAGGVEHPKAVSGFRELHFQITDVRIIELPQLDFRPLQSIVPPDRVSIPLHQFEKPLDDRLRQRVAGRAAVGIRVVLVAGASIEKIQQAGRNIPEPFVAQRPDRRPLDLGRGIEWRRRDLVGVTRRRLPSPVLRLAEEQDIVWMYRFALAKIGESARRPDLVALKNSGIALDRLHERAGFTLLRSAALAKAA